MTLNDTELLRRYAADGSESAFSELVRRHIDLVYSAALRMVDGDAALAEDVTQAVFTDLARKAPRLLRHTSLVGWLYTSTRYLARNARRTEQRRRWREQKAYQMNELLHSDEPSLDWHQLRPVLDDAMHALNDRDREAVLLRYFERRPLAEVGDRLGVSESAARMRVDRALDKLRLALAKRGVTSTSSALALALSKQAVGAAPAAFAIGVSNAAIAAAASGGFATNLINLMLTIKMKLFAGALGAGVLATALLWPDFGRDNSLQTPTPPAQVAGETAPAGIQHQPEILPASSSKPMATEPIPANTLRLTVLDSSSGNPVPRTEIRLRCWHGSAFTKQDLATTPAGVCDVPLLPQTTTLELTLHKDGFADTRLHWRPDRGEVIPQAYVVRFEQPVRIGGQVIDFEGRAVPDAKVGFNHQDDPIAETRPESHEFGWIEVTTDAAGYWSINRIHPDMLRRIYGGARHPEYVGAPVLFVGRDPSAEEQLREGTYVFQLGQAALVRGKVVDAAGQPIAGATVSVGHVGESGRREGSTSDQGEFSIAGCKPGRNLLTAEAPGYAATTERVQLSPTSEPFQLVLKPGKVLRLRVVDRAGDPIQGANVWLDTFGDPAPLPNQPERVPVQAEFNARTDSNGRVVWEKAPDQELEFDFGAKGFMSLRDWKARPNNEEYVVTLSPALTVSGTVRDAATGQPIPKFRMITGWPEKNYADDSVRPRWSPLERFWLSFSGGEFQHSYTEPVLGGTENRGYILKFEAEGYTPAVTRTIAADEGEVRFEINLRPAVISELRVLLPDGTPAAGADVGLVAPGARLQLLPGGFSRDMGQSTGSLLRTDGAGRVQFTPDESVTHIVVAHPSGYAELPASAVSANENIQLQLQPWGRIEGTYKSSKSPVRPAYFKLEFETLDRAAIAPDFTAFRVQCDEQGRFQFPKVPPGRLLVTRLLKREIREGGTSWMPTDATTIEVQPGETASVTLGGGISVSGRIRFPTDAKPDPHWDIFAGIHTPFPVMPAEFAGDPKAVRQFRQSPEFQAAVKAARHFPAEVASDGSFIADDVAPGQYILRINVVAPRTENRPSTIVAQIMRPVAIPENSTADPFDLGEILLESLP